MKRLFSVIALVMFSLNSWSQITITTADMPVHGDSLRYTNASPLASPVSAADSGTNMTWDYSLTGTSQGLDEYKSPTEVNPLYSFTLPTGSYGYKIADSIPGIGLIAAGISIDELYTFFNAYSAPSAFGAEAFGAKISGFPVGASYITPDVWYFFPLTYDRNDSADFYLKFGLPTVASLKEKGYRKSRVDGWGTITTPYFTSATPCIRIRSEIHEIDSVSFDSVSFGLPRVTVEYKYLVNGEHYPAVWATANVIAGFELITSVKYKDIYRPELNPPAVDAVAHTSAATVQVSAYPNPTSGIVTLNVPANWNQFYVEIFDIQSRSVATFRNKAVLDLQSLPAGNYVARVVSGGNTAFVRITR